MENIPFESPEPNLFERAKRTIGLGTYNVIGAEDKSQAEQRMIKVMHDRGGAGFIILRSAETGLKDYTRSPVEQPPELPEETQTDLQI